MWVVFETEIHIFFENGFDIFLLIDDHLPNSITTCYSSSSINQLRTNNIGRIWIFNVNEDWRAFTINNSYNHSYEAINMTVIYSHAGTINHFDNLQISTNSSSPLFAFQCNHICHKYVSAYIICNMFYFECDKS